MTAILGQALVLNEPSPDLISKVNEFNNTSTPLKFVEAQKEDKEIFQYLRAKSLGQKDKKEACSAFTNLAKTKSFLFKDLAQVNAYKYCTAPNDAPIKTSKNWLKKTIENIDFLKCIDLDSIKCINLYIAQSKKKLPRNEKIGFLNTALVKAKKINNKRLIKKIRNRKFKISPRLKSTYNKQDYLLIANDHLVARDFSKAEHYFSEVINGKFSIAHKIKAYKGMSKSQKLQRKYKNYVGQEKLLFNYVLQKYKANKGFISHKLLDKTCQGYSRATWSYLSRSEAQSVLNSCISLLKGKHSLASIYWILGRIEEEKKNYKVAVQFFDKALAERPKSNEFKDKVLWYKAWNERKLKKLNSAIKTLNQLTVRTTNRFAKAKYQFWLAQLYLETGQKQKATKWLNLTIANHPSSYYSLVAHKTLEKKIQYNKNHQFEATSDKMRRKLNLSYIDWLLLLKEKEAAQEYLTYQVRKNRKKFTESEIELVYPYYAKTNLYLDFFYLVSILAPERQNNLFKKNPELMFPQPFKDIVSTKSDKYKFSPHIVYSIMRQESAFNPNARSFADAFGLLQLIPEVANKASRSINSSYKKATDLFDPKMNISLGTYYLKQQWSAYQNQFILAAASYNATDKAIKSWIKSRYDGNVLQFIEDVPYEETRNYIKLVMRNYIFYKLINSDGSIEFPNYCLDMSKV